MDGVLLVDKPRGWTSHDVVQKVRGLLRVKRVGHTGTLDPMATGLLVLCIGKATRIAQYLEAQEKEYHAEMRLGVTTDTLDAEGTVMNVQAYEPPDPAAVSACLRQFTGDILQRPPAYSAVKVAGVPSYKMARKGTLIEHPPRPVKVHALEMVSYADPLIRLRIICSKGLYVRTLSADIGACLGMGAHLTALTRVRSGSCTLQQAFTLDQVRERTDAGTIGPAMMSIDEALSNFPLIEVGQQDGDRISHGNAVARVGGGEAEQLVRIHAPGGRLVALARNGAGKLSPEVVFAE